MENSIKEQTAVDWLYNNLFPKKLDGFTFKEWEIIDKAFKEAKEREKEQIIYVYKADLYPCSNEDAENYYNNNFYELTQANSVSLKPIIEAVLEKYHDKVAEYKSGKNILIGLFMGEIMKLSKGKADPSVANELLIETIKEYKI